MANKVPWITVEGVDGAGKSSHIDYLVDVLKQAGYEVVSTREPGGTDLGERLRHEILNTDMSLQTEVLLAFASRAEHLSSIIRPALQSNTAVVCDRFTDSTYAYQGHGHGYPIEQIKVLEEMVHADIQPDLTLIFDLPVEESMRRLGLTEKTPDRFESQSDDYFEKVRKGYLERAKAHPHRIKIIDAQPSKEQVREAVGALVQAFIEDFPRRQPQEPRHVFPRNKTL